MLPPDFDLSAFAAAWHSNIPELSSRGWRGVKMTPKTVAEIECLRRQLRDTTATPPATTNTEDNVILHV